MNDSGGWDESAEAWITDMGDHGDWGRQFVLDDVMLSRAKARQYKHALDVGCGEGRFCRKLRELGVNAVGLDPTKRLLEQARRKDPRGDYRIGVGESLPFANKSFDLVVSYLSLVDIEHFAAAISEMNRVLVPGGALLIANLTSFSTARAANGWERSKTGRFLYFKIDDYLRQRSTQESWRGIEIRNWHRPLSAYMQAFLAHQLLLTFFDEPSPSDDSPRAAKYRRAPWYAVMEWRKPETPC
jgi:SAM-dependent methyltransferase